MNDVSPRRRGRSCLMGCGITAAIFLVLVGALTVVFVINNRPPHIKIPSHAVPKDNGWDYFVKVAEMIQKANSPGPSSSVRPVDSWTLPEYQKFMRANAPALAVLRDGLKKQCMAPPVRDLTAGYAQIKEMAKLRQVARTLVDESRYYEKLNKPGKAMNARLDCLQFAAMIPRGGHLITSLVASWAQRIAMKDLNRLLPKLSASELATAAERIKQIDQNRWPYSNIVTEDCNVDTSTYIILLKHPLRPQWIPNLPAFMTGLLCLSDTAESDMWAYFKFAFANKSAAIRENRNYCRALAAEMGRPYQKISRVVLPQNLLSSHSDLSLRRGWLRHLQDEARLNMLETHMALRRYKLDKGAYPKGLAQLTPEYLKQPPSDPFGQGKEPRYRLVEDGKNFLLYSVGPNMRDDNGKPAGRYSCNDPDDIVLAE